MRSSAAIRRPDVKAASRRFLLLGLAVAGSASAAPGWVEKSNADAEVLLQAIGRFQPERASSYGLTEFDRERSYAGPDAPERARRLLTAARDQLQADLSAETDPMVRQDLQILLQAASLEIEDIDLDERYLLPYHNAARNVFQGEFVLLNEQSAPARHPAAVERLRRYTGLTPGTHPLTEELEARFNAALARSSSSRPALIGPYRGEVENDLATAGRFPRNIRALFASNHLLSGPSAAQAEEALAALDRQIAGYQEWVRTNVLPHARSDFRPPPAIYAHELRQIGIDIAPEALVAKAQLEYAEVSNELETLAPLVAAQHGWKQTGYREVIRQLKRDQLPPNQVESYYRGVVIPRLEALIREHRVATLPERPMAMRIASEGEAALQPAPHMQPPILINNHGERGTFVLPLGVPSGKDSAAAYDDFTFRAGAWTLTAHEGRPGHELQFDRMLERGVSHARAIFAFNSVNAEGWALYCESEMMPYEPLDGQLIALQLRLLRAARAICDPMMNLGQMTAARAHDILVHDVCISEAFAKEELDRFQFRLPAQAGSYFYGYSRLMELRAGTELALGPRFDRLAFNNFIVDQGLVPPNLLAEAVKKWSADFSE